jgi:hypothetical protein
MKMEVNDMSDLFNLVYVSPGMKYFTFDEKWQRLIASEPLTKNYLFQLNQKGNDEVSHKKLGA